jgi:assimilatory nitrate reductase catalytic subunit
MQSFQTTCPYCGVGCGVVATVDTAGKVSIKGDPEHPANYGRLCSKGAALSETLSHEGRLLQPLVDGVASEWEPALETAAQRLSGIIEQHGPDAVAFYVSGQLLTEDYYVANKLMKGFIGSANIDTNSRLCMSSAVTGYKRAFGADTVPCSYEDLERAKLIVLVGSNTAWCHPVLFQRISKAKKDNPDLMVVVIDPRRTPTCDIADMHLALQPGMDQLLFNGLLVYLEEQGELDRTFVEHHTEGLEAALQTARGQGDIAVIAEQCGLPLAQVEQFYRLFARTERVLSLFSQGINQWSYGSDRVNAIINCHLLTGRIGRVGMGPFSITGQPNAMGGREVGGLANQLAAHMSLANPQHRELVQTFWQAPRLATEEGLKAVQLFDAMRSGKIKAVWIMATNPAVSLPDANRVRQSLDKCELVIVSDCVRNTDTTQHADILFPAATWGEREGTVTNSERRISRQRAFLPVPGNARPDWWIVSQVAQRLGYVEQFDYRHPVQIFTEHAALSGYQNSGERDFNISALQHLSVSEYDSLTPIQWPVTDERPEGTARLFSNNRFYTRSGRANFVPIGPHQPANSVNPAYPFRLNSGRIRDQWHTMARTGKSSRLSGHIFEPYVEIHPVDAREAGVVEGELARVSSLWGSVIVRVNISEQQQPGSVFIPMHWNDQFSSLACVDSLVNPVTDPQSGQPEFKHTPVHVESWQPRWYGFILSRQNLEMKNIEYWSRARGNNMWRYEIAGEDDPENRAQSVRAMLTRPGEQVEWVEYFDKGAQRYRAARIENGCLESCIFIGPDHNLPERDWLARLFNETTLSDGERASLLSGRPVDLQADQGRLVCACFGVGLNTIVNAIESQQLTSVEQIGMALKAGTNCGSCQPELRQILLHKQQPVSSPQEIVNGA